MYPNIHTLRRVAAVGKLGDTTPFNLACDLCGREVGHYNDVELVLDALPTCDLVVATGAYFISEDLLTILSAIGARGYLHFPATVTVGEQFHLFHPHAIDVLDRLPKFTAVSEKSGPTVRLKI